MGTRSAARLLLTERALRDLADIRAFSIAQWGKRVAVRYVKDIEAGLIRVQEKPDLLRAHSEIHPDLRFYRVNKHVLVCDVRSRTIVVLTVIHASRDIPARLHELEPTLATEVELLHNKLQSASRKTKKR